MSARHTLPHIPGPPATALMSFFARRGTLLRLALHQHVPHESCTTPCSYLVRAGAVALETALPARHIISFWYPGDLLDAAHLPPLPQLALRALGGAEVWRLRGTAACDEPAILRSYLQNAATALRRATLAKAILALPSAEERLAAFLVSAGTRLGHETGNQLELPTPWSRADLAAHLALNPDTLSRTVTRLQEQGLLEVRGRHTLLIRDWAALCARTALAPALVAA